MTDQKNSKELAKTQYTDFKFYETGQGPLRLDGLLGAEMKSLLKIMNFLKSSFGVNVKVNISH